MAQKKIKIFLADDHHVFRAGIRSLLESEMPAEIVGEAASGEEVLQLLEGLTLDVLLLDIDMPGMSALSLMQQISIKYPNVPVLILTSHDTEQHILHMMKNGAKGYILKTCRKNELIRAVNTVHAGDSYLSKDVSNKLIYILDKKNNHSKSPDISLTKREIEILKLVSKGLTNLEIGNHLFISHRTVDTHRRNMMTKLNLHNAAALTNYAAQNGLLADKNDKP